MRWDGPLLVFEFDFERPSRGSRLIIVYDLDDLWCLRVSETWETRLSLITENFGSDGPRIVDHCRRREDTGYCTEDQRFGSFVHRSTSRSASTPAFSRPSRRTETSTKNRKA